MEKQLAGWTEGSRSLQRNLLFAIGAGAPGLQQFLLELLSPGDFDEGVRRTGFRALQAAYRSRCGNNRPPEPQRDEGCRAMVVELLDLNRAIRLLPAISSAFDAFCEDIPHHKDALDSLREVMVGELQRRGAFDAASGVWDDSHARTVRAIDMIEKCYSKPDLTSCEGISWGGLDPLDILTGGLLPGCSYMIGGDPGVGKTAFLLQLMRHATLYGNRVGYLSLRDNEETLALRVLAGETVIDPARIWAAQLEQHDFPRLTGQASKMCREFHAIAALQHPGFTELCGFLSKFVTGKHLDLVCIDDIDHCRDVGDVTDRALFLSNIATRIARVARRLEVPIVATAGLASRADDALPGGLSDTRFLQFAQVGFAAVLETTAEFLHDDPDLQLHRLRIIHNASGMARDVPLFLNPSTQAFQDPEETCKDPEEPRT